ncbi:MAG: tetratricopeptide repeat protein [Planctomycetota bacterium]|nr:tetratricopeptide repeat protein [Planctomycetota bacterium]
MALEVHGPDSSNAGDAHLALARTHAEQGHGEEAVAHLRKALHGYEEALPGGMKSAEILDLLGDQYRFARRFAEGEAAYLKALEIYERALGADDANRGRVFNNLGALHAAQGRYAEAEAQYRQALAVYEKSLPEGHAWTGMTAGYIGNALRWQYKNEPALAFLERALACAEAQPEADAAALGTLHNDLGSARLALQRLDDAEKSYTRALEFYRKALPERHAWILMTESYLLSIAVQRGALEASEQKARALLKEWEELGYGENESLLAILNPLTTLCRNSGRREEAARLQHRIVDVIARTYGARHAWVADSLDVEVQDLRALGRQEDALQAAGRSLAIREELNGPDDPRLAASLLALGCTCHDLGRHDRAVAHLRRALALQEGRLAKDDPALAYTRFFLAASLHWQRDFAAARPLYRQAAAAFAKDLPALAEFHALALSGHGRACMDDRDYDEAAVQLELALRQPILKEERLAMTRAQTLAPLASARMLQVRPEAVLEAGAEALRILERLEPKDREMRASVLGAMGAAALQLKNWEDARRDLTRALNLLLDAGGRQALGRSLLEARLAVVDRETGKPERARERLLAVLPLLTQALGAEDVEVATAQAELARTHAALKDFAEAQKIFAAALPVLEARYGRRHPYYLGLARAYADCLREAGQAEAAAALERRLEAPEPPPRP